MEGCIALPMLISAGGRPNVFAMSDTSWGVGVIRPSGGSTTGPLGPGPQAPELQGAPNSQQTIFFMT